jgi:SAM-dependent methyltransferase
MKGRSAAPVPNTPEEVLALLPDGWRLDGGPALDLDQALENGEPPPLPLPDVSFRLIWSRSAFTRLADGWAEWLLEAARLLADDGIAVVGLADRDQFGRLTGEAWDESRIGMTTLDASDQTLDSSDQTPAAAVFHSEWWLRSHWGRAFARVELSEREGQRHVVLREPVGGISAEQLERPAEGDERELAAASANASYLRSQLDLLGKRHRHQLAEQREETGRELMRRSFAAADLEWVRRGPGSLAMLAGAEYEATTSWRLTRPLRALGAMVRRLR